MFRFLTACLLLCSQLVSWEETKLEILPTCFARFENLYFNGSSRTFMVWGEDLPLGRAIYLPEDRGFHWKKVGSMPLGPYRKVEGTTVIVMERWETTLHFAHFFHFLEHLLGIWSFGGEAAREDVKLFLIASNGHLKSTDPWKGVNDITWHLIRALFPHAEIAVWQDFVESNKRLCFERAITSDRCMEYTKKEPYRIERMMGGYFQKLDPTSIDRMADRVYEYLDVIPLPSTSLRVTYVMRPPPRCLQPEIEAELLGKISELPDVELRLVDFEKMTFREQVEVVANTDLLLGAHGNGFSHTLFLPKGASLMELYPKNSFRTGYRIFSQLRGVHYYGMVPGIGWLDDETAERLGCHGNVNVPITVSVDEIMEVIKIIDQSHRDRGLPTGSGKNLND